MEYQRITQSEIETIKEAQKGNELAFNKLFNRYKEFVDNILFYYVNDMDEAKDLTNVVFLKVHQKLSTFTDYSSFVPSVFVVVANTATFNATIIENAITTAKSFDTFFI